MCTHFEHDIIQRKIDSVQAFALVSPLSLNELHDAGAASWFYVETRQSRFVFRCRRGDLKPSQAFFLFLGLSFNTQKNFPSSLSSSMRTFFFLFFFSIFLFLPTKKKLFLLAFSLSLAFFPTHSFVNFSCVNFILFLLVGKILYFFFYFFFFLIIFTTKKNFNFLSKTFFIPFFLLNYFWGLDYDNIKFSPL